MSYKTYKHIKDTSSTTCSCKYLPPVDYKPIPQKLNHFVTELCFQTIGDTKIRILE
jgi:hypothetical protein